MSWLRKLFGPKGNSVRDPAIPPPWEAEKPNPTVSVIREERGTITISCSTCSGEVSVPLSKIDDRRGTLWGCSNLCQDHFHIHGRDAQRKVRKGQVITSGVLVAIKDFRDWYIRHPAYVALGEESWMLNEHGLWAFCAVCRHQIISTVLCAFVNYQLSRSLGLRGYVFGASTGDSAREMDALQAGVCQRCSSKGVVAIMTRVPDHLREDYLRWQRESST